MSSSRSSTSIGGQGENVRIDRAAQTDEASVAVVLDRPIPLEREFSRAGLHPQPLESVGGDSVDALAQRPVQIIKARILLIVIDRRGGLFGFTLSEFSAEGDKRGVILQRGHDAPPALSLFRIFSRSDFAPSILFEMRSSRARIASRSPLGRSRAAIKAASFR